MPSFEYVRPKVLEEALAVLAQHGTAARVLAGGTDLLVRLRLGHIRPRVVVDLKRTDGLPSEISEVDGALRIGARVILTDLIEDSRVRRHFAALIEAALVVGSVQIRNRATLIGNICNASPAADTAPALLIYGARVNMVSAAGRRQIPLQAFFVGPGRTVLTTGELVESIDLPIPSGPIGAAFGRVTRRKGVDLATINLCCLIDARGSARFAYGAVGPKPFVVQDDTGDFGSSAIDAQALSSALGRLLKTASPISDVRGSREYRWAMLDVMSRRTWREAMARRENALRRWSTR